jgi:hypothetical protein
MWDELAVRGSIAGATASWALAEWLWWRHPSHANAARALWTSGAALTLLHVAAVFHFIHDWSQTAALAHTARQTAALTGLDWGGGLYVNYGFVTLWAGDAAWWWRDRQAYENRSPKTRQALLAVFLFMFINGGIVFARGPARAIGCAAVGAVLWGFLGRHRARTARRIRCAAE